MSTPKEESKTKETAYENFNFPTHSHDVRVNTCDRTFGVKEDTNTLSFRRKPRRMGLTRRPLDRRRTSRKRTFERAHNFASRSKCFKCTAPREPPANFKMGDWMCPLCGAHNYRCVCIQHFDVPVYLIRHFCRSKRNCFKCGGGKPATEGRNGIRPGDWMCPSCGAHNFKDKISCFSCTARKAFVPQMGQFSGLEMGIHSYLPANFKPGDWMCGQCGAHNYQSRTACYKCNNDKPSQAEQMQANQVQQVSQLMMAQPNIYQVQALLAQASLQPRLPHNFRPGDWMCGSCGAHNYRSRESCFKCNARKAKPEESQQQEEKQTQSQASAVHVSTVTSQPQAQEQPASTKSSAARTTTTAPQGQPQTQTQAQSQPTAQIQSAGHTVSQIPNQIPQGQMQSQMRSMGVMQGGYPLMQSVMPNPQQ
eukprot:1373685-Amorphochlora_amoeboformis.AAC.1